MFKHFLDAPIFVFIHGGYWQEFSKDSCGFVVDSLVSRGIKVVITGYDLCPKGNIIQTISNFKLIN